MCKSIESNYLLLFISMGSFENIEIKSCNYSDGSGCVIDNGDSDGSGNLIDSGDWDDDDSGSVIDILLDAIDILLGLCFWMGKEDTNWSITEAIKLCSHYNFCSQSDSM